MGMVFLWKLKRRDKNNHDNPVIYCPNEYIFESEKRHIRKTGTYDQSKIEAQVSGLGNWVTKLKFYWKLGPQDRFEWGGRVQLQHTEREVRGGHPQGGPSGPWARTPRARDVSGQRLYLGSEQYTDNKWRQWGRKYHSPEASFKSSWGKTIIYLSSPLSSWISTSFRCQHNLKLQMYLTVRELPLQYKSFSKTRWKFLLSIW